MSPGVQQTAQEKRAAINRRYRQSAKGRAAQRAHNERWRAKYREHARLKSAENRIRLKAARKCITCWHAEADAGDRCRPCQDRANTREMLRKAALRRGEWTEAMKAADRIAEMRELTEMALGGAVRVTRLDIGRRAA